MAANKFATMLHRNTHKITIILVYAVLEWVLIFLLLLNSLFSFLISKFAHYFGLKPPCLWCSRVDHILEPNKTRNSYRDLVCEAHATEISKLGYCPNHRKLAEPQNLCTDCSSTEPKYSEKSIESSRRIAFFTWVSENRLENGEKNSKCSCCDESLSSKVYPPPFLLFKPSWEALGYTLKGDLTAKYMDDENNEGEFSDTSKSDCFVDHCRNNDHDIKQMKEEGDDDDEGQGVADDSFSSKAAAEEDCSRSVSNFLQCCKKNGNGGDMNAGPETGEVQPSCKDFVHQSYGNANIIQIFCREDESINIMNLPPRISIYNDIDRLIPVELIDSSTTEGRNDPVNGNLDSEPQKDEQQIKLVEEAKFFSAEAASHAVSEVAKKTRHGGLERMEVGELVTSSIQMAEQGIEDLVVGTFQQLEVTEAAQTPCTDENNVEVSMKDTGKLQGEESDCRSLVDEIKCEIFPGMEVSGHELSNQSEAKDPSSSLSNTQVDEPCMDKKFGTESSWDGSVISEMEGGDGALTIEKLKSALRAERKALSGLYSELEEERSAATIAANQTMAMITRLQEEKAAMQMEALQYQRMMDEQSEYDQEALQLLNELMIKREKQKQELEKELEMYRKKVFDYEAKEKMMMRRKDGSARSRNSSACGNAVDMDELSIDLNRDGRDEDGSFYEHQEGSDSNTPIDAVLNVEEMGLDPVKHLSTLDESLAEFEEERLSILEELKALEEKLFTLAGDDEEQLFEEDVRPIGNFAEYGNDDDNYGFSSPKENGNSNGGQYPESNIIHSTSKKLLPLFDATGIGNEEGELNEEHIESDPSRMQNSLNSNFELVNKKLGIEEEVDHVYERLQALETDREFLKHCISSLKKGDKGMDLLEEILQHLRDLRTVELRARNICDSPLL